MSIDPEAVLKRLAQSGRSFRIITIPNSDRLSVRYPFYSPTQLTSSISNLLVNQNPYYSSAQDGKNRSFGFSTTVVTSIKVSKETVYTITKNLFENFNVLKRLHPAYSSLTKEEMLYGLSIELHPGALKYFREIGLM